MPARSMLPHMKRPIDLITNTEARHLLGVSPKKMADFIKAGTIKTYPDTIDGRVKLVSRAEIEKLKASSVRKAA
jgi:hypothetical protein